MKTNHHIQAKIRQLLSSTSLESNILRRLSYRRFPVDVEAFVRQTTKADAMHNNLQTQNRMFSQHSSRCDKTSIKAGQVESK